MAASPFFWDQSGGYSRLRIPVEKNMPCTDAVVATMGAVAKVSVTRSAIFHIPQGRWSRGGLRGRVMGFQRILALGDLDWQHVIHVIWVCHGI